MRVGVAVALGICLAIGIVALAVYFRPASATPLARVSGVPAAAATVAI